MNTLSPPSPPSTVVGLAGCYQLLGTAFAYPQADLFEAVRRGHFAAALADAIAAAAPRLLPLLEAGIDDFRLPNNATLDGLAADYLDAFELGTPRPVVSLYEGSYAPDIERSEILLEVKAFYQHFGLAVSDDLREPEDHLAAELEFMQFLTAKQAADESAGGNPAPYLRAQIDFLDRHLAGWLPRYATAAKSITSPFYRALSWLAAAVVGEHRTMLASSMAAGKGAAS